MRNAPYLQGYKNGILIILNNRKIFVRKSKTTNDPDGLLGYAITSYRIHKGRYWKPIKCTRNKHNIVQTTICYTHEAINAILQAINLLNTRPEYNNKSIDK